MSDWTEFVEVHGVHIGYDHGDVFIPIPPGNRRAAELHETMCPGCTPVYGPTAVEVPR